MKKKIYTPSHWIRFSILFVITCIQTTYGQQLQGEGVIQEMYANATKHEGYIRCLTTEMQQQQYGTRYELINNSFEEYMQEERVKLPARNAKSAVVYTIPVVFHIIHDGEAVGTGTNISTAQINAQLDQLNNDFRKAMGTSGDGNGVDTEIQFCAARVDDNNSLLAEPGINRLAASSISGAGSPPFLSSTFESTIKPATQWNPTKYLNIWVGDLTGGLLGYAQFPEAPTLDGIGTGNGAANTDGVVVLYSSVGSTSSPFPGGAPYDQGRTLTHEVGHWLGLRHIWGDGGCGVDDFCADTPLAGSSTFGCPTGKNSCTSDNEDDQIENYMDYSNDICMNMFTQCQTDRMRVVMGETGMGSPRRAVLLNSLACQADGFLLTATPPDLSVCQPDNVNIDFDVDFGENFVGSVTLSLVNFPIGLSATFLQNPITQSGSYTLLVTGTGSVAPGTYNFSIEGVGGNTSEAAAVSLSILDEITTPPTLTFPADGATNVLEQVDLSWSALPLATTYDLQLATDPGFNNLVLNENGITGTTFAANLASNTTFYWRVRGTNDCGDGPWSIVFDFTTTDTSPCLNFNGGPYTDFDNGSCFPTCQNSLDVNFEVWANEAYIITDLTPGAEYTFEFCDGYNPNVWEATITVAEWNSIAPGNVIDFIGDCSITFEAPAAGDIIIVITDACGNPYLQEDNGKPTFECTGNGSVLPESCTDCKNPAVTEYFENGEPQGWNFTASGSNAFWQFNSDAIGDDNFFNPGNQAWAYYDDDLTGETGENNIAQATSPSYDLSAYQNILIEFDYLHQDFVGSGTLTFSVTDGSQQFYWNGTDWTTTSTTWLTVAESGQFSQSIPASLNPSNLSATFIYDDETDWAWGFGFDNFAFCGDILPECPSEITLDLQGIATAGTFAARDSIFSVQQVTGDVAYTAREAIVLQEGFSANGAFHAYLEDCREVEAKVSAREDESDAEASFATRSNFEKDIAIQVQPNPFSTSTTLQFTLPQSERVTVQVLDAVGRVVSTPYVQQNLAAGKYVHTIHGQHLEGGIYYVRLQTSTEVMVRKMIFVNR